MVGGTGRRKGERLGWGGTAAGTVGPVDLVLSSICNCPLPYMQLFTITILGMGGILVFNHHMFLSMVVVQNSHTTYKDPGVNNNFVIRPSRKRRPCASLPRGHKPTARASVS